MTTIPAAVAAVLAEGNPAAAILIKFDFVSATVRVWTGHGRLTTLDGFTWDGLGEIVSVSGLNSPLSGAAPAGSISASGVSPDLLPVALGEEDEYKQRPVSIFLQVARGRELVGNPCALALRIMTTIEIDRTGETRRLTINHESPYMGRNNPAYGFYSDRDQQARHPGDLFCDRAPFLLFKQERWPDY